MNEVQWVKKTDGTIKTRNLCRTTRSIIPWLYLNRPDSDATASTSWGQAAQPHEHHVLLAPLPDFPSRSCRGIPPLLRVRPREAAAPQGVAARTGALGDERGIQRRPLRHLESA